MTKLHEPQVWKSYKILGYILTIPPSLLITTAGIGKIFRIEATLENMNNVTNFGKLVEFVGVLEIVILVLYWIPKTSNVGFFLMCSFCGGIIVAEVVSGQIPFVGIVVSVLYYVGTFLRKPSLLHS